MCLIRSYHFAIFFCENIYIYNSYIKAWVKRKKQIWINKNGKRTQFCKKGKKTTFSDAGTATNLNKSLHSLPTAGIAVLEASKLWIFPSKIIELLHLENVCKYHLKSKKLQLLFFISYPPSMKSATDKK